VERNATLVKRVKREAERKAGDAPICTTSKRPLLPEDFALPWNSSTLRPFRVHRRERPRFQVPEKRKSPKVACTGRDGIINESEKRFGLLAALVDAESEICT